MTTRALPPALDQGADETSRPFDRRLFWRAVFGGFALLALAGALMWLRFGSLIFFDMLAAVQSCF